MPVKTGLADTPRAGLGQVGPSSFAASKPCGTCSTSKARPGINCSSNPDIPTNTVNQTELTTENQLALAEFQYQVALGNLNRIKAALGRATEQTIETIETDSVERRVEIECP